MLRHIVSFKLKGTPEERLDAASRFRDALLALPEKLDFLRNMQVGINANPDEEWDIVLIADVDNWEDLKRYSEHPDHLAAAAIIKDFKDNRACVDFGI